ncbi:GNAT family N-acetyltransferase [Fictibacillus enclensis]|uniref:GNAT family N-acetyltransferase n=1 Tax=Fictibacillus enclensis TaxID=1017270 RepID=UPI0025A230C2|nr:GNAT family N-acetyltransferase [Fictibacillus enclensis]MDM5337435.1 GNAT family N-acetyltransferase [Fictibacillus enclensis]
MLNITQQWNQEDSEYIRSKLIEFNLANVPDDLKHPVKNVSFMVRDDEGNIWGGITGKIAWRQLYVDFLWLDESLRGKRYGEELLKRAEDVAREHNCSQIQLNTLSFQAPGFYQKYGFEVAGIIDGFPGPDQKQYYMVKKL